jgi:hypothetical protein
LRHGGRRTGAGGEGSRGKHGGDKAFHCSTFLWGARWRDVSAHDRQSDVKMGRVRGVANAN